MAPALTRRDALRSLGGLGLFALTGGAGALVGACASAPSGADALADPEIAALVDSTTAVDMHSHAAGAAGRPRPSYDLAERIRTGRMTAVCLEHSADGPVIKREPDNSIRTVRQPEPGELWRHTERRLAWFDNLVRDQGLRRVLRPGDLEAAHRDRAPAIVQAIEGCQFLEGKLERIAEVYRRGVRHLQLVHVDVAHATMKFVEAAAKVSKTPLILSHTSVAQGQPAQFSRRIWPEHAKLVAGTGGVVGVWASPMLQKSLTDYIDAVARAVDAAGTEHMGFGTDNSGFGAAPAVWDDYRDYPLIVSGMRKRGFSPDEIHRIAGGNYLRVFNLSVRAAQA